MNKPHIDKLLTVLSQEVDELVDEVVADSPKRSRVDAAQKPDYRPVQESCGSGFGDPASSKPSARRD